MCGGKALVSVSASLVVVSVSLDSLDMNNFFCLEKKLGLK